MALLEILGAIGEMTEDIPPVEQDFELGRLKSTMLPKGKQQYLPHRPYDFLSSGIREVERYVNTLVPMRKKAETTLARGQFALHKDLYRYQTITQELGAIFNERNRQLLEESRETSRSYVQLFHSLPNHPVMRSVKPYYTFYVQELLDSPVDQELKANRMIAFEQRILYNFTFTRMKTNLEILEKSGRSPEQSLTSFMNLVHSIEKHVPLQKIQELYAPMDQRFVRMTEEDRETDFMWRETRLKTFLQDLYVLRHQSPLRDAVLRTFMKEIHSIFDIIGEDVNQIRIPLYGREFDTMPRDLIPTEDIRQRVKPVFERLPTHTLLRFRPDVSSSS